MAAFSLTIQRDRVSYTQSTHNVAKFRAALWANLPHSGIIEPLGCLVTQSVLVKSHQLLAVELPATISNQLNNGTNYRVGVPQLMDLVLTTRMWCCVDLSGTMMPVRS
jgi:hypothetical protein